MLSKNIIRGFVFAVTILTAGQVFANSRDLYRLSRAAEVSSAEIYRQARYEANPNFPAEMRAVRGLSRLAESASRHREVLAYNGKGAGYREFQRLVRIYRHADQLVYEAHFSHYVDREFRRLSQILRDLDYAYRY